MIRFLFAAALIFSVVTGYAQQGISKPAPADSMIVEAACGQCRFGLKGKGCSLAVRMEGKAYFVDGTDIDSQGDAHASDGFCNAIRKAVVRGKLVNGRFQSTSFRLLPAEGTKKENEQ